MSDSTDVDTRLTWGEYKLSSKYFWIRDRAMSVSQTQHRILKLLMESKGVPVSAEKVWECCPETVFANVYVHINLLRNKVGKRNIQRVVNKGYFLPLTSSTF